MNHRVISCVAGVSLASSAAADIVGVTWEGMCVRIDPATGTALSSVPLSAGGGSNAMAKDDAGRILIGVNNNIRLHELNPDTGKATLTLFSSNRGDFRSLAFAPDSTRWLYAASNNGGSSSRLELWDLSTTIANPTTRKVLGDPGESLQAMTFGGDGVLYSWNKFTGLSIVNLLNAQLTRITEQPVEPVDIETLALGPDGRLYGGGDRLYVLDTATGLPTPVTPAWDPSIRLRGMEFIPSPGSPIAAALLVGVAVRRRRKHQ